mmetsp:Transcript_37777/g.33807  ORF Transcript_37777/g.33807 Transcript_37777/m.33807 type:complete len:98 (-) Transcript_37777:1065-1358(-)
MTTIEQQTSSSDFPQKETQSPELHEIYNQIQIESSLQSTHNQIFVAYSPELKSRFVAKIFNFDENEDTGKETISKKFIREARFERFSHPHIVPVIYS